MGKNVNIVGRIFSFDIILIHSNFLCRLCIFTANRHDSACEAKESCDKPHHSAKKKTPDHSGVFTRVCRRGLRAGRDDRTRTCGILVPNQALYQTELHPDVSASLRTMRYGAPDRTRICGLGSRSPLFYPAKLQAHFLCLPTQYLYYYTRNTLFLQYLVSEYSVNKSFLIY